MFCPNCGKEISNSATVCVNCGEHVTPLEPEQNLTTKTVNYHPTTAQDYPYTVNNNIHAAENNNDNQTGSAADIPVTGLKIISFLAPVIGLILYFAYKEKAPYSAKAYAKMAVFGFILGIAISIFRNIIS